MAADTTWNCVLYVDHHADREFDHQAIEEGALAFALGSGGNTREGTNYDRYDVWFPTNVSRGRPAGSNMGAALDQLSFFRSIDWHAGATLGTSNTFHATDVAVLRPWLEEPGGNRTFWATGNNLAGPIAGGHVAFATEILGMTRLCNTIRDASCPVGTITDSSQCLPLGNVTGSAFPTTLPVSASGNACPEFRSFDVLALHAPTATAKGQLTYTKNGSPVQFASITNEIAASGSKTVMDGFALGNLRSQIGPLCTDTQGAFSRAADVLGWFGAPLLCRDTPATSAVPEPGSGGAPPLRPSLAAARPNPSTGRTTIAFVNAVENGRVTIQIFDVTGRLVKSLMDSPLPAGRHETNWDGTTERGLSATAGLYFYRMTAGGYTNAKRFVLVR